MINNKKANNRRLLFVVGLLCALFFNSSFIAHSPFATAHAFHTSITRVDYNAKEKSLEVSMRVFTDDLELALNKDNGGRKFQVINGDANDSFVEKYVRKHFALRNVQKQKKTYAYVGKEQEADATWIYLEIPCRESINGFSIEQAIFFEIFEDQTNLVNFNYLTEKKSYLFKGEQKIQELGF